MRDIVQVASDRKALRRRVRLPCQVIEEEGFSLISRECVDLSLSGMGVRALLPAPVGTPLVVSFRIPGSSYVCDLEAEVSRVVWGRRSEDRHAALGIRFLSLDPLSRAILGVRLRGLPPPVPARRLRMDYAKSVRNIQIDANR